uniref:ATP-binding protein n=1 Tax=Actibacterium sp. TaxID=1872125 RepID=UPI0035675010
MSLLDPNLPPLTRRTAALSARAVLVLAVAVGLMALSVGVSGGMVSTILAAAAVTLVVLVLAIRLTQIWRAQAPLGAVRRFAENDPAPGFVTDPDGRLRWQNAAAEQKFTLTGAQTLIRALGDVFANPAAVVYRLQARAAAEGQAQEDIVTSRGHARIAVHQLAHKHLFWRIDETGERPAARGAEALCLPVLTVGRSGMVLFINDAARQFLGKRPKTLDEILPRPPANPGDPVLLNGASGALPARVALFETSGGRREVYLWPGAATEAPISDDAVLDALPVALLRLSADGAVVLANRSAREMLGQVPPGAHLSDLVEGLGRPVMDWLADVAEARVSNRSEVLQLRRSDQELFIQVSLERLADQGGTGFVAVLNDATELKTLEAQFVQSQKMQAIGQLAGGVAHDFNNLLTAITGHCDLLLLRHDAGDPEFGDLMQIQQNANRAASLVGQLLAFSRKQTLRLEQVDLDDTLADLTHLLNRLVGEKVVLTVSHDPNLAPIRADKRQLEQVIMNLVVNARDAMQGGGEIRIETAMNHLDTELRRDRAVVPAGDYVLVRVTDHGHGIAPDKLQKVFEPFFTTKKVGEGTGLGLSTAYGIV